MSGRNVRGGPGAAGGSKAAFAMFQQKDIAAGGTGKASSEQGSAAPTNPTSIKERLLVWCQQSTRGYQHVNVTNFSSSWADGMAFCALVHHYLPNSIDYDSLNPKDRRKNFEIAFKAAEDNGCAPLLEVNDMIEMGDKPDWKCVFTYIQSLYKHFVMMPQAIAARAATQAASN
ncbi:unnamed protein product [Rotaria magnacalcarata]|uniref:Calponin-homology (CH) domain-containing protein n=2 Tax=Rotaria magnacalcarata TaxID=392030 RepID=A0A816TUU9_9BILA|nr:unnamed protein product [Rotaria magnacalcarata]CAF2095687.1 unnamed protein product [Rotaria magnacalcarata]CAF2110716.1 unnamed protein product [Rotaria magnacalcarata]CAF3750161.1 unnamed protein product [Rotaria magnacalcarata]CAF3756907.1 unnamed protein product [Rotaria magnacalcarata]